VSVPVQAVLDRFLAFVEWGRVREAIALRTASAAGRDRGRALRPSLERALAEERQGRTAEAAALLERDAAPALERILDLARIFERADRLERPLFPRELHGVAVTLTAGASARAAFAESPGLSALTAPAADPELLACAESVLAAIGPYGVVYDGASEALSRIRAAIAGERERLRAALLSVAHDPSVMLALVEHRPVERDGRLCLKVRKADVRRVPGPILAEESGALFVEPDAAQEHYNRLRHLELDERDEVGRIATALSGPILERRAACAALSDGLLDADVHLALARLAREQEWTRPALADGLEVRLRQARHPILITEGLPCTPIDIELGAERRVLVISGPNGGGKTAAIKTVGLLATLAQSGAFVPAEEGAELPVFSGLLAAGGTSASSVHDGLSTFQAHARELSVVSIAAEPGALVLLDEVGLGTDPSEAAALAQALLEDQLTRGVVALATTHLGPLKAFAARADGAANAAVELGDDGRPTFVLTLGSSGKSYALEAARQAGLPESIYRRATELHRGTP